VAATHLAFSVGRWSQLTLKPVGCTVTVRNKLQGGGNITEEAETSKFKENFWWISWSVLLVSQIVLVILFYNWAGLVVLLCIGWIIVALGLFMGYLGVSTLKRSGGVPKGRSFIHTTAIVDTGIYTVVRHPQYLCWVLVSLGIILLSQHWIVAIIGVAAAMAVHMQARQDDPSLIERFGDDYRRYMQRIPRMNLLLGIIRLLGRRENKQS